MAGRMTDFEPDRTELQALAVRQDHVWQWLRPDLQTEHQGLLWSSPVQLEVGRVQIDRARIAFHQATDRGYVVQVRVRQENRVGNRAPRIQGSDDPLGFGTRVDDDYGPVRPAGSDEVAVRLESADGESENLEPADLVGGDQTEKEVPQPQEPVAFGFSNVKPEPLKLLW